MQSGPKPWPTVVRVAALAWLVVHFALTVAYVMPLNPVTAAMQPLLRATIGTYFPQGWAFFAPDPGWSVPVLLARPLSPAEAAAVPAQGLPADGWYDLSTPLWERFHVSRLSAYARIAYPQLRATLTYGSGGSALALGATGSAAQIPRPAPDGGGGDLAIGAAACPPGSAPPCEPADPRAEAARAHAAQLLARIASAFCNEVVPDREVSHVALRVREQPIAPWAERYGEPPPAREVDLGIFPIDRAQTAGGFWRGERPE